MPTATILKAAAHHSPSAATQRVPGVPEQPDDEQPSIVGTDFTDAGPELAQPDFLVPVRDAATGRYELVLSSTLDVLPIFDVTEDPEEDPGTLGRAWEEGRGQYFAYKWLHRDPNGPATGRGMQMGWLPVDPKYYSDPRYVTKEIAGLGKCLCYQDAILFEMPKAQDKAWQAASQAKMRKDQIERMYGMSEMINQIPDKSSGGAKGRLILEASLDTSDPSALKSEGVYGEIDSLNRARAYQEGLKRDAQRRKIPVYK